MFRICFGQYWANRKENANYCSGLKVYGFRGQAGSKDQVLPSTILFAAPSGLG